MLRPNFTKELFPQKSLVFMLGSSGCYMLKGLFRCLSSIVDLKQSKFVQMLAIDADDPKKNTGDVLALNQIFHCYYRNLQEVLIRPDLQYIINRINPEYLPGNSLVEPLIPESTIEGAGAVPAAGLLSFCSRREAFLRKLNAMDKAFEDETPWITLKDNSYTVETQTEGLRVVIVCSRCGGAGSGMAIELAAQIRNFYKELNPRIVGIFLGSSIFNRDADIPKSGAAMRKRNDFEFLMSLQRFSLKNLTYRVDEEGHVVQCPLFDIAFCLDQASNHPDVRRTFNSRWDAFHAAAELACHLILSRAGAEIFSAWSNNQNGYLNRYPEKQLRVGEALVPNQPTIISSVGLNTMEISSEDIFDYLAKKLTREVVQSLVGALDKPVPRREIIRSAVELRDRLQLTPEGILNALGGNEDMPKIAPTQFFDQPGQVFDEAVVDKIRQFVNDVPTKVRTDINPEAKKDELVKSTMGEIAQLIQNMIIKGQAALVN